MQQNFKILSLLLLSLSFINAFPVLEKRLIVTRVHTASTTKTSTYVYSTTTETVVAPTVEFIISGTATFTTTLYPEGVDTTVQPSTTITIVRKNANGVSDASSTQNLASTQATASESATLQASIENASENIASSSSIDDTNAASSSSIGATTTAATNDNNAQTYSDVSTASSDNVAVHTNYVQSATLTNPTVAIIDTTTLANVASTTSVTTAITTISAESSSSTTTTTTAPTTTNTPTTTTSTTQDSTKTTTSTSTWTGLTSVPKTLVYSPYNNDSSCKTYDEVYADLLNIQQHGVYKLRVYGTDCDSLNTIEPVAVQLGMTINQGLWISDAGTSSIDEAVADLIAYGEANGWDIFDFITIGNEAINSGYCTVDDLISKISSVKAELQAAGYTGKVTTSEPPVSFEDYPELCTSSAIDFVGINAHPYFDVNSSAETSGSFVLGQIDLIKGVCGTDNVYVTESGYPSAGNVNGGNVPSKANQIIAVQQILDDLSLDVTILSYKNDYWKDPGTYGIEQSFGIIDIMPSA
ncbi:hypothetical protein KAFR_0F03520 [Kazachstania africana CBS 2517]|uniref:Glycoside hydrolase family 17 protein n=1 Tax=Kazachstania africana (strain ATCC 22294 / BCRC 22015 / CBS 2517 / CECT 1963 / NBRC 1671 / NRRL Y-8276) TaxID=1071382 RepID=H2AX48_KAZAF|nr:hypothetical protein KAFR_0F03520 [Kazachstania africana CBS 2517]CCF58948.1 hypothetical protein KAFR_0F03520 [Kazachstania africana CBS 2517]